jgi:uncharacterized protein (DUF58 family)
MISRSGWVVLLLGALCLVGGRALGLIELYVVGATALALVIVALVAVRLGRLRLQVGRDVRPIRVHAGQVARVEVRATNRGPRRTPVLRVTDPVAGTKGARLQIAPLPRGDTARAAYRLPTERRGLLRVGPLRMTVADPFHLASVTVIAAPQVELVVLPRIEVIAAPSGMGGRDPHAGREHASTFGHHGEDFHSLRPYNLGDDLRRVHWPTSARHDDLFVRNDEVPWQGRTTVILDTRLASYDEEEFERAVTASASIISASLQRRQLVRLVTTDGLDAVGAAAHDGLVEHLATVERTRAGSMKVVSLALSRGTVGGALVLVTGRPSRGDLDSVLPLSRRFGRTTAVLCGPVASDLAGVGRLRLVAYGADRTFASVWADAHGAVRAPSVRT